MVGRDDCGVVASSEVWCWVVIMFGLVGNSDMCLSDLLSCLPMSQSL